MTEVHVWTLVTWCIISAPNCGLMLCDAERNCEATRGPNVVIVPDADEAGCERIATLVKIKSKGRVQTKCAWANFRSIATWFPYRAPVHPLETKPSPRPKEVRH
jgi:hypothetical protein